MNKKTIIAYVLIGLVIIGFFKFNQKSPEDIQREKARQERIAQKKIQDQIIEQERAEYAKKQFENIKNDTASIFHNVYNGVATPVVLTNDKVSVTINTLGGRITSASLKEYKDQQGGDVILFDSNDKIIGLIVDASGETPEKGIKCESREYTDLFIGATSGKDVDVLSGASFTSWAIQDSVDYALANLELVKASA